MNTARCSGAGSIERSKGKRAAFMPASQGRTKAICKPLLGGMKAAPLRSGKGAGRNRLIIPQRSPPLSRGDSKLGLLTDRRGDSKT